MNYKDYPTGYSHPEVDAILNTLNFDRDTLLSIRYVLKIHAIKYHFRERMAEDDRYKPNQFVDSELWISSKFFEYMLSSHLYTSRLQILVDAGILKKKVQGSAKGRHTLYGFANRAWYRDYKKNIPILSPRVIKKIASYSQYKLKHYPDDMHIVIPHIIEHFYRIDLDRTTFFEIWTRRYYSRYLLDHTEDQLSLEEYMDRGEISWLMIEQWNSLTDPEKTMYFTVCQFGRRLHYIFTYLPNEVRAYCVDRNGNRLFLTDFDMRNCQPAILANLLVERNPSYKRHFFVRLVERARLYKWIRLKLYISDRESKNETLRMIYCKPYYKAHEQFKKLFPDIARETKILKEHPTDDQGNIITKKRRYTLLPQLMQRAESSMFRPLWVQFIKQGFIIMPIHDGIYFANVTEEKKDEIQKQMELHITNYIKIRFHIKQSRCSRMI